MLRKTAISPASVVLRPAALKMQNFRPHSYQMKISIVNEIPKRMIFMSEFQKL